MNSNREVFLRSNIRKFPRPDLLKQEQVASDKAELARIVESFRGSDSTHRKLAEAVADVSRDTAARVEAVPFREFLMLYTHQNLEVAQHLRRESKYKIIAPVVWAVVLRYVVDDTYEVLVTRDRLIAEVGASPQAVRQVLKELVNFKALRHLREPEPGKQGRGTVRYFLNAKLGSREKRGAREASFASAPRLGSVVNLDGSTRPTDRRSRAPSFAPEVP